MKFGVRECANIVFRAKQPIRIGTATFQTGQPVLYIDTATTSSMEQSTATVYAQGGRGNARLLAWEGQKTLTFSFTDALLSPIGFAILSGAGLFKRGDGGENGQDLVHFHMTSGADLKYDSVNSQGTIDLRNAVAEFGTQATICKEDAPIYIMEQEEDGSLTGRTFSGTLTVDGGIITIASLTLDGQSFAKNASVMVDYYVDLPGKHVWEADITPETFGGNYYVEADTLFRDQHTGKDLPANLTFPNVRLQSNFTMTFAGTGDPSTFDFTMDAFPDYTYFDRKKKVLAVMQIADTIAMGAGAVAAQADDPVMYHDATIQEPSAHAHDSNETAKERGQSVTTFDWADETKRGISRSIAVSLANIKDAINFADYVYIIDSGEETNLSAYKPKFTLSYTDDDTVDGATAASKAAAALNYISISADGYIVAKAQPNAAKNPELTVKCELPACTIADGGNALTLEITIGAQG